MAKKSLLLIPLVVTALGAGLWWQRQGTSSTAAAATAASATPAASGAASGSGRGGVQTVGVFVALKQDVPVQVEANGTVAALNSVDIRPQVSSTVRDVLVKDGQAVRRGDVLFRFDDRADRANLDKARAQLTRDQATLADLERQFKRAQELREQNFIAQSGVDSIQTQVEAQRALLLSDQAAIQSAEVSLSYQTLRAPFNGRAGAVAVSPGSLVTSSTAVPLVTISQLDPVGVTFTLPEAQVQPLLQALRGKTPLEATIVVAGNARGGDVAKDAAKNAAKDGTQDAVKGTVKFVDNLVDSATGTIKARAEFDNRAQLLWPGQYVRLRLKLRTLKDAVLIPQAALILRGNDRSVYVVDADRKAQMRPVQVRQNFGELVVVEGVQAGEKVVVDGKQNLRPGGQVRDVPVTPEGGGKRGGNAAGAASGPASAGASDAVPADRSASGARP